MKSLNIGFYFTTYCARGKNDRDLLFSWFVDGGHFFFFKKSPTNDCVGYETIATTDFVRFVSADKNVDRSRLELTESAATVTFILF